MNAIEMIKERRSVRNFKDEVVDREIMSEIIGDTVFASTWANLQPVRYTIVKSR
ncbi:MAG: nitroreductase family protein [Spirochaetales bacterium]|uniref:Nitroreductase family protein n=1 Tax=Candidatus Thalassospirochaeta sargassi TaxID=3119039 RepID=A0AAJ1IGP6_9SPIO|nr:nitroreductase family protein [Spirochaetales bacterium]